MKIIPTCLLGSMVLCGHLAACSNNEPGTPTSGSGSTHNSGGSSATSNRGGSTSSSSSAKTGGDKGSGGTSSDNSSTASEGGSDGQGGSSAAEGGSSASKGGSSSSVSSVQNSGGRSAAAGSGTKAAGGASATAGNTAKPGGATGVGGTVAGGGRGNGGTPTSGGVGSNGGTTGSGGTMAAGGSTTQATATPCKFPSSWTISSPTYTYYSLPNAVTACGYKGSNNTIKNIPNGANFAAIPGNTSQDFNTRDRCGACVKIGNAIITIVDECPNDTNAPCKANPGGHLDLSQAATNAAGVKGDPALRNQAAWSYVPCPVTGNVIVRLKQGNNNEFFIENSILPIAKVVCGSQTATRTYYGAWHCDSNIDGDDCTATDVADRSITFTVGTTQDVDVDTKQQFPKCL